MIGDSTAQSSDAVRPLGNVSSRAVSGTPSDTLPGKRRAFLAIAAGGLIAGTLA